MTTSMMTTTQLPALVPVEGAVVREVTERDPSRIWRVQRQLSGSNSAQGVWLELSPLAGGQRMTVALQEVRCGLMANMVVQDVPLSRTRRSLGEGRVVAMRTLAGREQALVELFRTGQRVWMPYEHLRLVRDATQRFCAAQAGPDDAERFRLRTLAHLLERWHQNTGALTRLEIDPLPHQLHLVHHILRSGNLNWMIADDVGLGKTIEVGMLLSALLARKEFRRILIVTPGGLTTQWQEELKLLFGLDDFMIHGRDFHAHDANHWRLYPRVIASMDRLKRADHLESIHHAGAWDLIVFDEGHRLSSRQYGEHIKRSERYLLAASLRQQTDHMMLLTATPHQGREDAFVALLELLRPEWREHFEQLHQHTDLLRQMIYRNRKIDVTDAQGQFIFKGHRSLALEVPRGDAEEVFDRLLSAYLERGEDQASSSGRQGKAIGFVMTVYRKLAASSHAAILKALRRRRERILSLLLEQTSLLEDEALALDERFESQRQEDALEQAAVAGEFFSGELEQLQELIALLEQLLLQDKKLEAMHQLLSTLLREDAQRRILIFTEFRSTQEHLEAALAARFGAERIATIHGGKDLGERRQAQLAFNEGPAQFLISTEAGGEGLNLQRRCHTMINYDLPWNPMRMVQRMGRLYRYGQTQPVVVCNLKYGATLDARVVELLYERLEKVVQDMGAISDEYHERLHAEILGELASLVDVEAILAEAAREGVERTQARIDEAIQRARQARQMQEDLLADVMRFDPEALRDELELGPQHVAAFVEGMLRQLECVVLERTHQGRVLEVRLSPQVQLQLGRRGALCRLTTSRDLKRVAHNLEVLDMTHPLFRLMLEHAQQHDFGGLHASLDLGKPPWAQAIFLGLVRWQDDQGKLMREELVPVAVDACGQATAKPAELASWLCSPAKAAPERPGQAQPEARRAAVLAAEGALDACLRDALTSRYLHPLQRHIIAGAWAPQPSRPSPGATHQADAQG